MRIEFVLGRVLAFVVISGTSSFALAQESVDAALARVDASVSAGNPAEALRTLQLISLAGLEAAQLERVTELAANLGLAFPNDESGVRLSLSAAELALTAFQQAHPGDDATTVILLKNVANRWSAMGDDARSLTIHQDALAMLRRVQPTDGAAIASCLLNVAKCQEHLGAFQAALDSSTAALEILESIDGAPYESIANARSAVASNLSELERHVEALAHYEAILASDVERHPGDHPDIAAALNNVAHELSALGRHDEALIRHQDSLAMKRRLPRPNLRHIMTSLGNVGMCLLDLGRPADALPLFEEARDLVVRSAPAGHVDVALATNNLAGCLSELGRTSEALPLFEIALSIWNPVFPSGHPRIATGEANVAACLAALGRSAEAIPRIEMSLAMRRRLFGPDHGQVALGLSQMAYCLKLAGRNEDALAAAEEALALTVRLDDGDHPARAKCLNDVAACLDALKRHEEAKQVLEAALAMWTRLYSGDHQHKASTLAALAKTRRMLDEDDASIAEALSDAAAQMERLRAATTGLDVDDRASYFDELRTYDPFPTLRAVEIDLGRFDSALFTFQSSRNRSLLDLLAQSRFDPLGEALLRARDARDSSSERNIETIRVSLARVEKEIDRVDHEVTGLVSDRSIDDASRTTRQTTYDAKRGALSDERTKLTRQRARLLAELVPIAVPAPVDRVRAALEPGEVLLAYAIDGSENHVFIVNTERVDVEHLPVSAARIGELVSSVRTSWGLPTDIIRGKAAAEIVAAKPNEDAVALCHAILPSRVWETVRRARRVIVVPDGPLHQLPLEAIVVESTREGAASHWLDVGPPIAYIPAISVLVELRRKRTSHEMTVGGVDVLALGDPTFDVNIPIDEAGASVDSAATERARAARGSRFGGLKRLPGTVWEVNAIRDAFGETRVRVLLGEEATESALFELSPGRRFIHLATHGVFDELGRQSFSALAFSRPRVPTAADDGFLVLGELLNEWRGRLNACEMVVLSSCDMQRGAEQRNEAPMAMSIGFLHAGASSVVASLWKVSDRSTAELMIDFYGRLASSADGHDRLLALNESRKIIKKNYPSPRSWAPFVYVGLPD